MEKIQNLLKFTEFDKNWKSRGSKNNKRTTTGLDIIEKKSFDEDDDEILDGEVIDNEDMEDIDNMDTNIDDDIDDDDIDDDDIDDDDDDDMDDDDMDDDDMDDWKMKLTSVIEDIIGDADASIEEIVDFINQEFVDDLEDDDDDLEDDDDDLEDDDDDLEDESIDDDEGEDITESFRRFKRR